jgi:hypothetical protein
VEHTVSATNDCYTSLCHNNTDIGAIHTNGDDPPGCGVCHESDVPLTRSCGTCHPNLDTFHEHVHANASGTTSTVDPTIGPKSAACTKCHGTDIPTVHEALGCFCHTSAPYLRAEMGPLLAAGKSECVDCHKDNYAPHGFAGTASGHSTTTFGKKGVYTAFNGLGGNPLLLDTQENTVTTTWAFPAVNVFWSLNDTSAPSSAIKGLTKDSVVTCQDCHTGLESAMGPHGANEGEFGIDPNYPGAYKYAVLGARKGQTEDTSTSGIKFRTSMSDAPGYTGPSVSASTGMDPTRNVGNDPTEIADGTKGDHAVICAKCHDLYNAGTGTDGWSNAYGDVSPGVESIHGMHAGGLTVDTPARLLARGGNQGRTDGRSDCINCHVAIPHGWSRPRLLVNGYTGEYPTGGTETTPAAFVDSVADPFPYWQGRGQQMSPGVSPGNGPLAATEQHTLNSAGVPIWDEQMCISCSGGLNSGELEHGNREPQLSNPAKLK